MNAFIMLDNESYHSEQFVIVFKQINPMYLYGWFDDNWDLII
jgi:hypothetical protein